jgi:hypothetical protein
VANQSVSHPCSPPFAAQCNGRFTVLHEAALADLDDLREGKMSISDDHDRSIYCNDVNILGRRGRFSLGFFVELALQMADALRFMHSVQQEQGCVSLSRANIHSIPIL